MRIRVIAVGLASRTDLRRSGVVVQPRIAPDAAIFCSDVAGRNCQGTCPACGGELGRPGFGAMSSRRQFFRPRPSLLQCVCVCVCADEEQFLITIGVCVFVCVCVAHPHDQNRHDNYFSASCIIECSRLALFASTRRLRRNRDSSIDRCFRIFRTRGGRIIMNLSCPAGIARCCRQALDLAPSRSRLVKPR
jgi:hypothetical protein